ncbi:hypothetical protein ACJ7V3_07915 [Halomonas elongata]|uniref:hypothetical protein n=1 Tax=Halomonas elongata TaxID=2746 RepID=UPI0038D47516
MKISKCVQDKKELFMGHSFFDFLNDSSISVDKRISFLPYLSYFVMSFSDLNKYILPFENPKDDLEYAVNIHSSEDANHWQWLLNDIRSIGEDKKGLLTDHIKFLWSDDNKNGRLLTYKLMSLVYNKPAKMKLVAIEVMEATGNATFETLAHITKDRSPALEYCGDIHLSQETGHAIGSGDELVDTISYSQKEMEEVRTIVDEGFMAFESFFSELEKNIKLR